MSKELKIVENLIKEQKRAYQNCFWDNAKILGYEENVKKLEIVKVALERKEKLEKAFEIIENHKLLNYVLKNDKCASAYKLTPEEIEILKEMV